MTTEIRFYKEVPAPEDPEIQCSYCWHGVLFSTIKEGQVRADRRDPWHGAGFYCPGCWEYLKGPNRHLTPKDLRPGVLVPVWTGNKFVRISRADFDELRSPTTVLAAEKDSV